MQRYNIIVFVLILFLASLSFSAQKSTDNALWNVDIPYEKFVLKNGLTLIVHEDHKAPIVAVNVWYHVGSKNEKAGKTGFAHLFEHIMFNGSENFDDDYFQALDRIGATDRNGTTNRDRTNYFQNVPTNAFDVVLWLESDRMGHLLGAVTQEKLDEQRGVVQNEKRQGENQPYGKVYTLIAENSFPEGHPYSWSVIGSMEDLNAASLEDVHEWFKTYYGPNNAVVVVAGDVTVEEAKEKVEKYFGDIPPGPPIEKYTQWIAKRSGEHRQIIQDRVPQARVYKVWNIPNNTSDETDYLNLVSDVLSSGKTSRFYKRLVYDDQIATDVSAYLWDGEIAGQFIIQATARPGEDLAKVEQALDEELQRFLDEGPTPEELQRVKVQYISGFVRGIERIGGFGGKSDILAMNEVYEGSPDAYKKTLATVKNATPQNLHAAARNWLSDGVYVLEVHPFPQLSAQASDIDRSQMPSTGAPPSPDFPELQRATLSNGLKIVLAERHSVPVVSFDLLVDAGFAADQFTLPGTANLAMNMLDEGTEKRSALQISEELALLGARLSSGSNLDVSMVSLSALSEKLDGALDIYTDVILNPAFPEADFQRLKKQQLAAIQREKVTPVQMALRVFPQLLYGGNHAYGNPFTGSGTEASVSQITRETLRDFHTTWFKPNNATMVVVGAISLNDLQSKLEKYFKDWKAGDVPEKNIAPVAHKDDSRVYILDRPGSQQSIIFSGHVAPPKSNPNETAIEMLTTVFGGEFTSRINMNLREDKHWAYGAFSFIFDARGQRPFIVYAPVQTDKTKESMMEIKKELTGLLNEKPVTAEELNKVKENNILKLPGNWETNNAIANSVNDMIIYNLPEDYWDKYPEKIKSISLREVNGISSEVIHPDKLVWVVVGDREKIEAGIRELGYGSIEFIDADGNPVTASAPGSETGME